MAKIVGILTLILVVIGGMAVWKKSHRSVSSSHEEISTHSQKLVEISIEPEKARTAAASPKQTHSKETANSLTLLSSPNNELAFQASAEVPFFDTSSFPLSADGLPDSNRIEELFNLGEPKLPLVETLTYTSRVDWHKGSPAWIGDYASHYNTSKHFIARSLNQKADYLKQDVAEGNRFNVFKPGKAIEFWLVIDISRSRLWFYAYDGDLHQRTLLKTYDVTLGRPDPTKTSGLLTPLGVYTLGSRIATYRPGIMGNHKGQQIEMIRTFGTRWIPFDKEVKNTTAPAKGFGIHGVPWKENSEGALVEDTSSLRKYESDGCIRMATQDIEELYAIVITKPTTVVLVKDFDDAELPGKETL